MPWTNGSEPGHESNPWPEFWQGHGRAARELDRHRQVLRTCGGRAIADFEFHAIVQHVLSLLAPSPHHDLLDVACGNGCLTIPIAAQCRSTLAIDISSDLLASWPAPLPPDTTLQARDARTAEWPEQSFDRVLLYAALQYFSHAETIALLQKLVKSIRRGGWILLGDLPDATRQWAFFNTTARARITFAVYKRGNRSSAPGLIPHGCNTPPSSPAPQVSASANSPHNCRSHTSGTTVLSTDNPRSAHYVDRRRSLRPA